VPVAPHQLVNILSILSQSPADEVTQLAEAILPRLGDVSVIQNRTGIAMLPYRDSAHGVTFHVGEVLMAEAHVRCSLGGAQPGAHTIEGYGACLGRDTRHALALALIDAAWRAEVGESDITSFVETQRSRLEARDGALAAAVERTRVEMETF